MPIDKVTLLANCLYRCGLIHDVRFCENEIEGYLSDQGIPFKKWNKAIPKEGANKQVISSQADSLIKISRIWADFFPANTSNQPI